MIDNTSTESDAYEILGVDRFASDDEVRRAYKQMAKRYHPDLNDSSDATEKMQVINLAGELLGINQSDRNMARQIRAEYDSALPVRIEGVVVDMETIFEDYFGGHGFRERR